MPAPDFFRLISNKLVQSKVSVDDPFPVRTPKGLKALNSSFTRPADTTAYVQYDIIANSTSAATAAEIASAVQEAGEAFRWEGARLRTTNASAKGKTFRVHLFRTNPTLSVNDNGAFNSGGANVLAVSDIAGYVGYIDVTLDMAGAAGAAGRANIDPRTTSPSSGTSLYWVAEVRDSGGYTPTSGEVFTLTLEGQSS